MYLSKATLELLTFVLLSFSHVARAAPRIASEVLEVREGGTPANAPAPTSAVRPLAQANPVCNKDVTYSLADTLAICTQLRSVPLKPGEDPNKTCWTDPSGGCNLLQSSGGTQLQMCGPQGHAQQFASCLKLAGALETFNIDCQTNYQVGGHVVIPYLDGVTLELRAA